MAQAKCALTLQFQGGKYRQGLRSICRDNIWASCKSSYRTVLLNAHSHLVALLKKTRFDFQNFFWQVF